MADESGSNPSPDKVLPSSLPSENPRPEPNRTPLNLLLAEDNLPDALLLQDAVKGEGLAVRFYVVVDGEKAIDFFTKAEEDPAAPCPHALLLDLNLPRVDGLEVLRRLRAGQRFKDLPVLIVTSSDSPADRNEAARYGAYYFRKAVSYAEFMKVGPFVRRFLEETGCLP